MPPGGFTPLKLAGYEEQMLAILAKPAVEEKLGKLFYEFRAINFMTQVVNGTNYWIKVHAKSTGCFCCENSEFLHIKIHKPLPGTGRSPVVMEADSGHNNDSPFF